MAREIGAADSGEEFLLLARFAGTDGAVEYQLSRAAEIIEGDARPARVSSVTDADEGVWSKLASASGPTRGLVWRACVRPSALGLLLTRLHEVNEHASQLSWHAGAGDGRLRVFEATPDNSRGVEQDATRTSRLLGEMREAARVAGGSLVVERASSVLRQSFDPWGLSESAAFLMQRVKGQLDPSDTFSPGRFSFTDRRAR
jgi:FAD/FMN-containing dehydrogenase